MSVKGDDYLFGTAGSSPDDDTVAAIVPFVKIISRNARDEDSEMEGHDVKGYGDTLQVIDIGCGLIDCRKELELVRRDLDSAKSKMASLLEDHEACRAELTKKQCELDETKSDVVLLSRDLEALHQRCQAERRDSEALIESLRKELEICRLKLEEDTSHMHNAIVELQSQFQGERSDSVVRIESLSKELENRLSQLKEAESNLEDTRARAARYSKELEDCKAGKNRVEGDLDEAYVKLKALEDQKKSCDSQVASLSKEVVSLSRDLKSFHQRCQAERRDSETQIELLQKELEECRSKSGEEKSNLQNAIARLQSEFQDERSDCVARIRLLSKELADCRSKLKAAESNLEETAQARMARYYMELEDCKTEKNRAEGLLGEAHVKLKMLEDQKNSADGRVASLSKELLEWQARLDQMESKVKDANSVKNAGWLRIQIRV